MYKLMITLGLFLASAGVLAAGDAKQGEALTATCLACHGSDGNSLAGSFPNIAGQNEAYLYKQLVDIQTGARSAVLMTGILDGLTSQNLEDLAAYYARKHPHKAQQTRPWSRWVSLFTKQASLASKWPRARVVTHRRARVMV